MRIFPKLLLVLFLTSFTLLLILYGLIQWGVDRGMLNYVNQRQAQSLQLIADNLAAVYQEHGDWQKIVASSAPPHENNAFPPPRHLAGGKPRRPFNRDKSAMRRQSGESEPQRNDANGRYWHIILRLSEQNLKYPEDLAQLKLAADREGFSPRKDRLNSGNGDYRRPKGTSRGLSPPRDFLATEDRPKPTPPKYSLLNQDKTLLIGLYADDFVEQAILVNDNVVGYVALPPAEQITDKFDLQFVDEINQYLLWVLAGIFAVIVTVTIPLSSHFVRPITRLKKAVVKVNSGKLTTRLPITGNDELATLARNFNDLAATLEQNEVSRKRWLADIAHELRTPLAIIKGEVEAMEDGIRPLSLANIKSIADEVSHLQRLINDLNELNQAEIGAMRYQKSAIDLNQLVHLNAERHRGLLKSQGLSLTVDLPKYKIKCWADATRLNQLIDNLFSNCAKYTDEPGQVSLLLQQEKGQACLYLEDSTPGVTADELDKLFEHLYRVDSSRNRNTGGSGIGLALCKNIVRAHQGEITASASKLGGLMIKITIPTC